jgi:hypothetical protein
MSYTAVLCAGLLAAHVAAGQARTEATVRLVGAFTNFRETGEHVYGYDVELWRRPDGTLTGSLSEANGQPADFPTTRLDHIEFDARTGHLRFTAAWCDGRLTFEGRVHRGHLRGRLEQAGGRRPASVETIDLRRFPRDDEAVPESEWDGRMADVFRRLKPRC